MNDRVAVDVFAEDIAHEKLLPPLIRRVASEEKVPIDLQIRSSRGGRPNVLQNFKDFQRLYRLGLTGDRSIDVLVVAIDGNCSTFSKVRKSIEEETIDQLAHCLVSACPDPHVEHWYLVDPDAFFSVVGYRPSVAHGKCERDFYKNQLHQAVRAAGKVATLGGIEFAEEIAASIDFFRAGKVDASFKAFADDLRTRIRRYATA